MGTKITLRRQELGLTVEALADLVDEPARIVRNWELHVPVWDTDDAKWESALQVAPGWLRAELDREALSAARAAIMRQVHSGPARPTAKPARKKYIGRAVHAPPRASAIQVRRQYLELSLLDLSERTSIHWAILRDFETALPAATHLDSIIESALFLPHGSIRAGVAESAGPPRIADDMTTIISNLVPLVSRDKSPANVVAKLQLALQRYGMRGEERAVYRVIGEEFGMSGQRAQQVVTTLMGAADATGVASPAISFLAREVESMLPARLDALTAHFRPLLGAQQSLEGVNRFATDFLGKPLFLESAGLAFALWDHAGYAKAATTAADTANQVGAIAQAMVRRVGAAQDRVLARAASKVLDQTISPEDVVRILRESYSKFEWLTQESGWFWFGPKPVSTIMAWVLKLLLAADRPLRLNDVTTGLARGKLRTPDRYNVSAALPEYVLMLLLEKTPEIKRTGKGDFSIRAAAKKLAPEFVNATEQLLVDELRRQGGAASRPGLMSELVAGGKMGSHAFDAALVNSPLFQPLGDMRWTYVGASPT